MVRYGIMGFGLHATKRLMPGFATAANSTVSALSTRDIEKARRYAAQFCVPSAFDNAEELCVCPEVDAVFVATPNACHHTNILTAVRHGKPVLCEKPLALNARECEMIIAAARTAGVLLGVAHCFRFSPVLAAMRQRISAGEIGRPVLARAEFSFVGVGHARKWLTNRELAGGGPIIDIGVHCIDALRYVLQDEAATVTAIATADDNSGDVEASALLNLEFSRGLLAAVAVSNRAPYHTVIEIAGTDATLRAENAFALDRAVPLHVIRDGKVAISEEHSNAGLFARQLDAFSRAVEKKTAFEVPAEEGLRSAIVLDAAFRSIASGRIETI